MRNQPSQTNIEVQQAHDELTKLCRYMGEHHVNEEQARKTLGMPRREDLNEVAELLGWNVKMRCLDCGVIMTQYEYERKDHRCHDGILHFEEID